MTLIINLFGGPGIGKSTSAAYLYAQLKHRGINAELIREYIKDWAYEKRSIGVFDQLYFLGKQIRRESVPLGKVDVLITDSPVWQGVVYATKYCTPYIQRAVRTATECYYAELEQQGHYCRNVLLQRSKAYVQTGRFETEAQARELDDMMLQLPIQFETLSSAQASLDELVASLVNCASYFRS